MRTLNTYAGPARPVPSTKTNPPSRKITHGCCQTNPGADYTWTMRWNSLGRNWLVLVDPFSKYPCIHPTGAIGSQATIDLLEEDFAHFGYPHALVTDNAFSFTSKEFKSWCQSRGITHLTRAPYHPATNGTAERMVQSLKKSVRKSSLPLKRALQEFLMQYLRTPLAFGLSPSELLNGRQITTKIDALWPEPAHLAQGKQATEAAKSQQENHAQFRDTRWVHLAMHGILRLNTTGNHGGYPPWSQRSMAHAALTCVWCPMGLHGGGTSSNSNPVMGPRRILNLGN